MVLTGVIILVAVLPAPLQLIAQGLPVTHALIALRASVNGSAVGAVTDLLAIEAAIAVAYGVLGLLSFLWFERVVKRRGTLERSTV